MIKSVDSFRLNIVLYIYEQNTIKYKLPTGNQEVSTFGGSSNGEPCHFPFYYRGVEYNGCTNDDYSRRNGKYVCGVKQNTQVPKADSITWGYCNVIGEHFTVFYL